MLSLKKYQNKKIAIYGMGLSGCSVARTLIKGKSKIFCWDDNKNVRKKIKKLDYPINKFWLKNNRNKIDYIVISPGINIDNSKLRHYLKKNFKKIITDLDIFFGLNKNNFIISITGTNGKSTTCKIVEKILKTARRKVKTAGNIGQPVLSLNKSKKKSIFVLEISSYQLQYSKIFRSQHAAILNISPDHLERHKNINNYIKIKSRIFSAQTKKDYSYINFDNKYSKKIKSIFKSQKFKSKLVDIKKDKYKSLLKKINNKYFQSKGNVENLIFSYKIAKNLKIKDKIIIKALNKFKGLPHRQEIIFKNKMLTCVNDSKATSFDAALQSLSNYDKIYWLVGGIPKLKDKYDLKNLSTRIVRAYIIGKHTSYFRKKIGTKIPCTVSGNIQNAITNVFSDLKKDNFANSTILLSPSAASFDQFKNFEDRGNYFKSLITKKIKRIYNV